MPCQGFQPNKAYDMKFKVVVLIFCLISTAYAAGSLTDYEQAEILSAHNFWRSEVNTPGLAWSPSLAGLAQAYAETLKNEQACKPAHSQNQEVGENLFWASPTTFSNGRSEIQVITPTQVVNDWGSEIADYDSYTNTCGMGKACGHYTQIIWRNTAEVGCGKAVCLDNSQIWVCHYQPAGNFIGEHPYK